MLFSSPPWSEKVVFAWGCTEDLASVGVQDTIPHHFRLARILSDHAWKAPTGCSSSFHRQSDRLWSPRSHRRHPLYCRKITTMALRPHACVAEPATITTLNNLDKKQSFSASMALQLRFVCQFIS